MCKVRGKTWTGSDPICAFDGAFDDNWNCATLNEIRDIVAADVDGSYCRYCDDQFWAVLAIDEVRAPEDQWIGYTLWMTWYKNRGHTELMYVLGPEKPRPPTQAECLAIIRHYRQQTPAPVST